MIYKIIMKLEILTVNGKRMVKVADLGRPGTTSHVLALVPLAHVCQPPILLPMALIAASNLHASRQPHLEASHEAAPHSIHTPRKHRQAVRETDGDGLCSVSESRTDAA